MSSQSSKVNRLIDPLEIATSVTLTVQPCVCVRFRINEPQSNLGEMGLQGSAPRTEGVCSTLGKGGPMLCNLYEVVLYLDQATGN